MREETKKAKKTKSPASLLLARHAEPYAVKQAGKQGQAAAATNYPASQWHWPWPRGEGRQWPSTAAVEMEVVLERPFWLPDGHTLLAGRPGWMQSSHLHALWHCARNQIRPEIQPVE